MKLMAIVVLTASLFSMGCAATTASCPPGKSFISYDKLHSTVYITGLAALESEIEARDCGQEDVAIKFHGVLVKLEKMDDLVVYKHQFDDDGFLGVLRDFSQARATLKARCPTKATTNA
jgi:hypothetical protein